MRETWRKCTVDDRYSVSNLGRVRRDVGGRGTRAGTILNTDKGRDGYPGVTFSHGRRGKSKHHFVHRLVAAAFFGPAPAGLEVNHKNGNKADARLENLEYVTPSDNCKHAFRTGLNRRPWRERRPAQGEIHGFSRLTNADVQEIRRLHKAGVPRREVLKQFDVKRSQFYNITRYLAWRHLP